MKREANNKSQKYQRKFFGKEMIPSYMEGVSSVRTVSHFFWFSEQRT